MKKKVKMALGIAVSTFMAGALLAGGKDVVRTEENVSATIGNYIVPVFPGVNRVTVDTYGKKITVRYPIIMEGATGYKVNNF